MSEVHKAARENMTRKGTAFDSAFHAAQQVLGVGRIFSLLFVLAFCCAVEENRLSPPSNRKETGWKEARKQPGLGGTSSSGWSRRSFLESLGCPCASLLVFCLFCPALFVVAEQHRREILLNGSWRVLGLIRLLRPN